MGLVLQKFKSNIGGKKMNENLPFKYTLGSRYVIGIQFLNDL